MVRRDDQHAVYATAKIKRTSKFARPKVESVTFRVGQPTDWPAAQARWQRLDARHRAGRNPVIRHDGRSYPVAFFEVRKTDRYGRRLDSLRTDSPLTVPYNACTLGK